MTHINVTDWFMAIIYGLGFAIPVFRMLVDRHDRRQLWDRAVAKERRRKPR